MRFAELITRTNNLVSDEEVACYYKGLRQSLVIWESFNDLDLEDPRVIKIGQQSQKLNAGTLGIYSFDIDFNFSDLETHHLPPQLLEKVMLGFEEYILSDSAVVTIDQAAMLALALLAKNWDSGKWSDVFQEMLDRKKLIDNKQFERYWLPTLIVVFSLLEDKEAFLEQLLAVENQEIVISSLVHLALSLPVPDTYKAELLDSTLYPLGEQAQVKTLRLLRQSGGSELTTRVALHLLQKYNDLDLSLKSTREYWQDPLKSTQTAFRCQAIADIALLAEEEDAALQLNEKALAILSALVKKGKVKKAGIVNGNQIDLHFNEIFVGDELNDPDIQAELVYSSDEDEIALDGLVHPVNVIQKSKKLIQAGNYELARKEIQSCFTKLTDRELEKLLIEGPDQIQTWEPEKLFQFLLEAGAYEAAQRISVILLRENPTSIGANLAAAKSAQALGNTRDATKYWEALSFIQPELVDFKRELAASYSADGRPEDAYEVYKHFTVQGEQVELSDWLTSAELALQVNHFADALNAAAKMLDIDPEDSRAFMLLGIAHGKAGNLPLAEENLRKSILLSVGDNRPWLELAELHWSAGAHAEAIAVLKEGLAANPGEVVLQKNLAIKMMQENRVSEAYPVLFELSKTSGDLDSDLLMIEAMERLGMEGVPDMLEEMVKRYPEDARFIGEYGKRLVWSGEPEQGLDLLAKLGDELETRRDWKLAFIEVKRKPKYCHLSYGSRVDRKEISSVLAFLNDYLISEPENEYAMLLKAESLYLAGEYEQSYQVFTELQRLNVSKQVVDPARLYTGLSMAAASCGQLAIANSALDQAIRLEPEWHALQAVKARVLQLTGETAEAATLISEEVAQASSNPEDIVWAIRFLRQSDHEAEAEKLLVKAIQEYPDHLGVRLMEAENSLGEVLVNGSGFDVDQLFALLQGATEAEDLVRAAAIFAERADPDRIKWCLEKAAAQGDENARFNLAGLHRINKEYQSALDALEKFESNLALVRLLKAETLLASGENIQFGLSLVEPYELPQQVHFQEVFLPSEWKVLCQSSKPAISLGINAAMKNGDFSEVFEAVQDWIGLEPGSNEALVMGIELALASGKSDWYEQLMRSVPVNAAGEFVNHTSLLVGEHRLDRGEEVTNPIESHDLFESINAEEPEKLVLIQQLCKAGRIPEAEKTFEMAMSVFSNLDGKPLVIRMGILRNLAKCAMNLDRWSESIELLDLALELAPAHEQIHDLRLQAATMALEFEQRALNLSVKAHGFAGAREYAAELLKTEIESHSGQDGRDTRDHWLTRLQLAYEPTTEYVRALAQRTPSPDDAAAMMAGLRAIGQTNTALLIGKKFKKDPIVLFETALCVQKEKTNDALNWLIRSIELDSFQVLTLRLYSDLLEKTGALPEAVSELEKALELWPTESKWHIVAADLWKRLGHTERPVQHLQIASTYNPNDVEVRRLLGDAYLASGNFNEALPNLLAVVRKNPQDYDTWIALSEVYQAMGEFDRAMGAADKAAEVNPAGVKARLQAGRLSWATGDLKQAITHTETAAALDPTDPANYVFLARLAREQGDTTKALELLEKAAKVGPAPLQTVIEHANLIKEINGVIAARDLIATFSQEFPENPDLLTLLAEAEEQCGDPTGAEIAAKKALEIRPTDQANHMLLGKIVEKNGNLDQAAHYYSQAVSLDGLRIDGYLKLSQVYIKQREFQKARHVLEQGISKIPGNVELYLLCASLLKEAKDYRGAEQMLRRASQIEPRNVSIHRQLGAILALNMVHQSQEVGSQV